MFASARGRHQIAHVARPGGADVDAVEGIGEHAHDRGERREQHELACDAAHFRARRHQVDKCTAANEEQRVLARAKEVPQPDVIWD